MLENGMIIAKDGSIKRFGTWVPRPKRDINNDAHFHDSSFRTQVYQTEWWKKQNIKYDENKKIESQLESLAEQGLVIILNGTEQDEKQKLYQPRVIITAPSEMSREQIDAIDSIKEEIRQSANDVDFIDMIESIDGNYINIRESYYKFDDFLEQEITPKLEKLAKK